MNRRKLLRWCSLLTCAAAIGFVAGAWIVGGAMVAAANHPVGQPPADLPVVATTLKSASGSTIAAWTIPAEGSCATVILLHGIGADRTSLVGRAKLFHDAGYSVVAIDLQAHGESPGAVCTIGYLERLDVQAVVEHVRATSPDHRIGVIGCSLGGAAALLASPLNVDAMAVESVYPTIEEAVRNRVSIQAGSLSCVLAPALLCQLPLRLGISSADLRPIDRIADAGCPILVASGDLDQHTTLAETCRLYEAASEPKRLVIFQSAAHVDLLAHDPEKYASEFLAFFDRHLKYWQRSGLRPADHGGSISRSTSNSQP